ncbi:MAG: GTPase, partial [Chloroflexota bacterium]
MPGSDYLALRNSLRVLRDELPRLRAGLAGEGAAADPPAWHQRLAQNVLPALDFDLPVLLVAICGGGSTGKSTLFNALAGRRLAEVGFRAGLTTRVLLVGHPRVLSGPQVAEALLYRLQARPELWRSPEQTI